MRIDRRFSGPPGVANGGYVAGRMASVLEGPVEVTLRAPTPLETDLLLDREGDRASLRTGEGGLLAEAVAAPGLEMQLPTTPASYQAAERARTKYVGFHHHPYPGCFVCGPTRPIELGQGLELFPGAIDHDQQRVVAAPFLPPSDLCDDQGMLRGEFVWAALDCTSWFGYAAFLANAPKALLGRLAVQVTRRPAALERCVVHGFAFGQEGRRIFCGSALAGQDGRWLASARATWVALKDG